MAKIVWANSFGNFPGFGYYAREGERNMWKQDLDEKWAKYEDDEATGCYGCCSVPKRWRNNLTLPNDLNHE